MDNRTKDEIFRYMTEQDGGMLGRSMYDAIFNEIHVLAKENQKYKEVINKAIKYIEENKQHEYRNGNLDEYYLELNEKEMTELLDILKECDL